MQHLGWDAWADFEFEMPIEVDVLADLAVQVRMQAHMLRGTPSESTSAQFQRHPVSSEEGAKNVQVAEMRVRKQCNRQDAPAHKPRSCTACMALRAHVLTQH